jgi:predicted Holliday junction resolvase-like endonuclease
MKKFVIFLVIVIIIVAIALFMCFNYKVKKEKIDEKNSEFETYLGKEIYGLDVATLINKASYKNRKNNVEQDKKGKYIDNGNNSVNIDIKMLDDDKIYNMEKFYKDGTMEFVEYYKDIKFKVMNIEYHQETGLVKYIFIEQITK